MSNYLKFIALLLLFSGAMFFVHSVVLDQIGAKPYWQQTTYSLHGMYIFGTLSSFGVLSFVFAAFRALPKQLGFVFLGAMTLKVIAAYIYIHNGLGVFENDFLEFNFLAVFFLFLFFDVFVAFKLVNQVDITD